MTSEPRRSRRLLSLALLGLLLSSGASVAKSPTERDVAVNPRPLGPAERAAVQLAIDYFERGPVAWHERLAADAPLARLETQAALAEIEVRAGVARGADWRLQTPTISGDTAVFSVEFPTGQEEVLELRLVREGTNPEPAEGEGSAWMIHSIHSLVDPVREESLDLGVAVRPSLRLEPVWWSALLLLLVAALWILTPRRGHLRLWPALVLVAAGLLLPACRTTDDAPDVDSPHSELARLGELLPLRKAMTGTSGGAIGPLLEAAPTEGIAGAAAQAWNAALLLQEYRLDEAEAVLDSLQHELPLADLLRARMAAFRGEVDRTPALYEHALGRGIDHDGLRLEAADVFSYLGIDDDAEIYYRYLGENGSREVQVYYNLARLAAIMDDREAGEQYFERGWALEPVERSELFDDPLLAWLCTRDRLFQVLQLDRVEEPATALPLEERDPMALPADTRARISGNTLRLSHRGADLVVPAGGVLAGPEVPTAPADAVSRRERSEALGEVERLRDQSGSASLDRPLARRQRALAARALFEEKRWAELDELTADLDQVDGHLDPIVTQLRARALIELGEETKALRLLIRLAKGSLNDRLTAPATLYQLAEILVERQQFDLAIRLLEKAEAKAVRSFARQRIRQVKMMKDLAEDSEVYWSDHFEVHYPPATGERYARQIAVILEEELKRLRRWIPLQDPEVIKVDLFPLRRFLNSYAAGIAVAGIYDGRVRVPFADLKSLHPELIAILSHELAHAMIAQATHDNAPRWFHEGLAQHTEMVQNTINPVPDLHAAGHSLSLPVVQEILGGFAEPQFVDLSYSQAAWTLHFIEDSQGRQGIHRLLEAFARGESTEEAIRSALETSVPEFDQAFWAWSFDDAPPVWPTSLRRYDEEAHLAEVTSAAQRKVPSLAGSTFGRGQPSRLFTQEQKVSMRDWHFDYNRNVADVRTQLSPVIAFVRAGKPNPEIRQTCKQLSIDLTRLLHHDTALSSPDPAVNRSLRKAFQAFEEMSRACQRGRATDMQIHLKQGERALGTAARALQRHGLQP